VGGGTRKERGGGLSEGEEEDGGGRGRGRMKLGADGG